MTGLMLFDHSLSGRLCLALLHSLWQVTLLALIVRLMSLSLRKRSVEFDYVLHLAALVMAMLALPMTFAMVEVPTSDRAFSASVPFESTVATTNSPKSAGETVVISRPVDSVESSVSKDFFNRKSRASSNGQRVTWLKLAPWLCGLYTVGVLIMLVRLGAAVIRAERLRSRAHPVTDGELVESLSTLAGRWSLRVVPVLARVESIVLPKVIGLLRPMILIPTAALAGLSAKELEMILVHELAHVRRYDLWGNLLQRLVEVVLFFNPAAWYLSRRASVLREYCCDEMTCRELAETDAEPRLQYVTTLLRVVELSVPKHASRGELTALAIGGRSPSELRRRVARILGEPLHDPHQFSRGGVLALAAMALLVTCGPLLTRTDAQTTDPQTETIKTIEKVAEELNVLARKLSEKKNDGSTKVFSFGSKIEILALGTHDEQPQRWWDIHGRPLASVPFTMANEKKGSAKDTLHRKVVFRIHDYPDDAKINWSIPLSQSYTGVGVVIDGKQPSGYFARHFDLPKDLKTAGLKIGVATGPWMTVAKASGQSALGVKDLSIVFSEPVQTATETMVIVSHNCFDRDFRMIAVDKQGKTHAQSGHGGDSAGKIYQSKAAFPNIKLADIDRFEFQVRDYEWIEFENLPLEPVQAVATEMRPTSGNWVL